jgi:hypothetical protein
MKRLAGQAGVIAGTILHDIGLFILTAFMLLLLAFGALAFRLSEGPLQIPYLASRLAEAVSGQGIQIHIGKAALAWAGYSKGGGAPLDLQLTAVTASNAEHVTLAQIPDARLVFLPSALLGGQAPIVVDSSDMRFNGSDVAVSLLAAIRLNVGFRLARADLRVRLGPGRLGSGDLSMPISSGAFSLHLTPHDVALVDGRLTLLPAGGSAPVMRFSGSGQRGQDWRGQFNLRCDRVQAADLPTYWPAGLSPQTRQWVTTNIIAGNAHDANFTFLLTAPQNLSRLDLVNYSGSFTGDNLTLDWLPGVMPITALYGTLTFLDRDTIMIASDRGTLNKLQLSSGTMKITGVSGPGQIGDLAVTLGGGLPDALAFLNAPPLNWLHQAPPQLLLATGNATAKIGATIPLGGDTGGQQLKLAVDAALTNVVLPTAVPDLAFSAGALNLHATLDGLTVNGTARLAGQPAALSALVDFHQAQGLRRFDVKTALAPALLDKYGLTETADVTDPANRPLPLELLIKAGAGNQEVAALTADLAPAKLALPMFGWRKPAGVPGKVVMTATLTPLGDFVGLDGIDADAPGLAIHGQVRHGALALSEADIGRTNATGTIARPSGALPWRINLSGQSLYLKINSSKTTAASGPSQPKPPSGPQWQATLNFASLYLAAEPAPALNNVSFAGYGSGSEILSANALATDPEGGPVNLTIRPAQPDGAGQNFHLDAADAGALLLPFGAYNGLQHGVLTVDGVQDPAGAISGTLKLTKFRILRAPLIGKILQAMTIYGAADAVSGPGLQFDNLVAPFRIAHQTLTLTGARAYSSSLGFTVAGTIALGTDDADLQTTIIPLYAFNALPGKIPLIGRLFRAEKGGGLISLRAKVTGPLDDPKISVNPLSALTPGVLQGLFGVGKKPAS